MTSINRIAICILLTAGCSEPEPPAKHFLTRPSYQSAETAQEHIDGWGKMGMWLPNEVTVAFFRENFESSRDELRDALSHTDKSVRMRAAYVIGEIGSAANAAGDELLACLSIEPDETVRMYLVNALNTIGHDSAATITFLANRYESLDAQNVAPNYDKGYPPVDEKITIAAALYTMVDTPAKQQYYDFVTRWLDPPKAEVSGDLLDGYWDRRWMAVNSLERMPTATEAISKLESLLAEPNAKSWVNIHVPRVLAELRKNVR